MATTSIVGKFATTLFQSGPLDSLATLDFYNSPANTAPQSQINTDELNVAASAAIAAKKALSSPLLAKLAAMGTAPAGQTQAGALANLQNASGGASSPLGITSPLTKNILATLGIGSTAFVSKIGTDLRSTVSTINSGRLMVGQAQNLFKPGNLTSVQQAVGLLQQLTGNSAIASVLDMQSQFAMASTLLQQASALGIPALLDSIVNLVEDVRDQKSLLLNNLRNACVASDMAAIQLTINKAGASACVGMVPDIISLILQYYKIPMNQVQAPGTWSLSATSGPADTVCTLIVSEYAANVPVTYQAQGSQSPVVLGTTDAGGYLTATVPMPVAGSYPFTTPITVSVGGMQIFNASLISTGAPGAGAVSGAISSTVANSNYNNLLNTLKSILLQLNPTWFQTTRNSATVGYISPLATASNDAITLFLDDSATTPYNAFVMAAFARNFFSEDIHSIALRYYTKAALQAPPNPTRAATLVSSPSTQPTAAGILAQTV